MNTIIDLIGTEQVQIDLIQSNSNPDITLESKENITVELIKTPINIKGESAYQIAVRNGFIGTELEWLKSLKTDSLKWNSITW